MIENKYLSTKFQTIQNPNDQTRTNFFAKHDLVYPVAGFDITEERVNGGLLMLGNCVEKRDDENGENMLQIEYEPMWAMVKQLEEKTEDKMKLGVPKNRKFYNTEFMN